MAVGPSKPSRFTLRVPDGWLPETSLAPSRSSISQACAQGLHRQLHRLCLHHPRSCRLALLLGRVTATISIADHSRFSSSSGVACQPELGPFKTARAELSGLRSQQDAAQSPSTVTVTEPVSTESSLVVQSSTSLPTRPLRRRAQLAAVERHKPLRFTLLALDGWRLGTSLARFRCSTSQDNAQHHRRHHHPRHQPSRHRRRSCRLVHPLGRATAITLTADQTKLSSL